MNFTKFSAALMMSAGLMSACKKDVATPALIADGDAATTARAIYSSRTVTFDRPNGVYTLAQAQADFGNISGWDETNAYTVSYDCRIKLLANQIATAGGMITRTDITDDDAYEVSFDVKYGSGFEWGTGGKVGGGFQIGDGVTACTGAAHGQGASARLMWGTGSGRTYFYPYVYHVDMPGTCGTGFGAKYPVSTGNLATETWYNVKIYVKSNTGTSANGAIKYTVNGTVIYSNTAFRWTTDDTKRLITYATFQTYRGGSDIGWATPNDGYVYYDNFSWRPL
jgi:hypothetical protein